MVIPVENVQHKRDEKDKRSHKRLTRARKPVGCTQELCQPDEEKYQSQKSEEKKEYAPGELLRERVHRLVRPIQRSIERRLDAFEDALQKKSRPAGIRVILFFSNCIFLFHTDNYSTSGFIRKNCHCPPSCGMKEIKQYENKNHLH